MKLNKTSHNRAACGVNAAKRVKVASTAYVGRWKPRLCVVATLHRVSPSRIRAGLAGGSQGARKYSLRVHRGTHRRFLLLVYDNFCMNIHEAVVTANRI